MVTQDYWNTLGFFNREKYLSLSEIKPTNYVSCYKDDISRK